MEDKRIEAFELRKNKDNNRKFNKQVKELRKQEGAQQRKAQISEVSNLRKDAAKEGKSSEEKVKQMIDEGPATKSKKRINMVRNAFCSTYYVLLAENPVFYIRTSISRKACFYFEVYSYAPMFHPYSLRSHLLLLSLYLYLQDKKYGFGGAERKKAKLNDKK